MFFHRLTFSGWPFGHYFKALLRVDAGNFNKQVGQSVLAMITSAKNSRWPLDVEIEDLDSAGLPSASIVRMKLFTLDDRLIIRKAGVLSKTDTLAVLDTLHQLFNLEIHRNNN